VWRGEDQVLDAMTKILCQYAAVDVVVVKLSSTINLRSIGSRWVSDRADQQLVLATGC
jgi:hypothetical protein